MSDYRSVDTLKDELDAHVRRATLSLLNASIPPAVHKGYASIRSSSLKTVTDAAELIRRTLHDADIGEEVLAGAVAEQVKKGVTHLASQNDYTQAVNSIT